METLRVNNLAQFLGPVELGSPQRSDSVLKFYNSSSAFGTFVQAGNATSEVTYTLPISAPKMTNSVLQSTSAGVLSWGSNLKIGLGPLTGLALAATTGGSLAGTTYYYNVYPVDASSNIGDGQSYKSVVVGGSNNAVNITWTAVDGASTYRVSRGTTPDGYDGYYSISGSLTTYKDTGAAFTSATNPFGTIVNSIWETVNGWIVTPASNGGYAFKNFETGLPDGYIQQSSAGELVIQPGSSGAAAGNYVFADKTGAQLFTFSRVSTHSEFGSSDSGGGLGDMDLTCGTNLNLRPGNTTRWTFTASTQKGPDGSNTAPAYSFSNATSSGMFKSGTNSVAMVANGTSGGYLQTVSNGDILTTQLAPLATNAAAGFLFLATCAGTPTGTPTAYTGQKAFIYDTSANKIWVFNGSWRGIAVV